METIDDMLDVVPEDLDDLRLKPVQSRRLQRAIEERRQKRAIEDIDVDVGGQSYIDTTHARSSMGTSQHRSASPDAAESITAAVRALQRAEASRAERTVINGTSASTAWEQSSTQSFPTPTRMDASEYVDPVAAAWADSIMSEERDPVAGFGPAQCAIGVVDRLFCEVKPLLTQHKSNRDGGLEHDDERSQQLLTSPPPLPHALRTQHSMASRMYDQLPEHVRSTIGSTLAEAPIFERRPVHDGSLSSSKSFVGRRFIVGPGIHLRDGVDDDVLAALASVTSRPKSPIGDSRAMSAWGQNHFGVDRSDGSPSTPSSTGGSLSRRGFPSSGAISRHGPIVTPTASALERLLSSVH
eukprot:COSAG02_NODE_3371_length_6857_cov_12.629328_3_plen_354_part_00